MMDGSVIARYQPPSGDIYRQLAGLYGDRGALIVAQAAATGDRYAVNDALTRVKFGERLNDSTFQILWQQLSTDPLAAPLETLDKAVSQIFDSKGVLTILALAAGAVIVILILRE